jgi:hypothetical protein
MLRSRACLAGIINAMESFETSEKAASSRRRTVPKSPRVRTRSHSHRLRESGESDAIPQCRPQARDRGALGRWRQPCADRSAVMLSVLLCRWIRVDVVAALQGISRELLDDSSRISLQTGKSSFTRLQSRRLRPLWSEFGRPSGLPRQLFTQA